MSGAVTILRTRVRSRLPTTAVPTRAAAAVLFAMAGLAAAPAVAIAAPLVAAFDRHVTGRGFDIGLVDATTGATIPVPFGVNTAADELHPALTPDGRFVVFSRTTLLVQSDGDVIPPETREVIMVDRQTGKIIPPIDPARTAGNLNVGGSGATIVPTNGQPMLAFGKRIPPAPSQAASITTAGRFVDRSGDVLDGFGDTIGAETRVADLGLQGQAIDGTLFDIPHAAVADLAGRRLKATSVLRFAADSGNSITMSTRLIEVVGTESGAQSRLLSQNRPQHSTPRVLDGHLALDITTSSGADIATLQFPSPITAPSPMPAPVNTTDPERMPAWSPDGLQLGFVRTTGTASATPIRKLLVFDSTPGLQTIVNPAVQLGAEAPTSQLRAFQATWGGLSLALRSSADSAVLISCSARCVSVLGGSPSAGAGVPLQPFVGTTGKKKASPQVGIVIARRVGTRRLFGSNVPRIRTVGRVPLGIARSGKPKFRWNGRVNGRRLAPGNYLVTFRTLTRKGRILSTSRSIQFKLTRNGRVTGARALNS